jgi:ABC-type glycerol-3-phosphate transport system permease component
MAGSLVTMVPIIIIFLFNQRFFIEGIKLTGIKG